MGLHRRQNRPGVEGGGGMEGKKRMGEENERGGERGEREMTLCGVYVPGVVAGHHRC